VRLVQHEPGILLVVAPLPHRPAQLFLPGPEGPVGVHPASQPGPGLKQGLVGQFGGVWPGELAGDGDQAGAGQPVDEPPFPVAELVVAGHPPGVRGTPSGIGLLARPDHLDEDPFDVQALAFVDPLPEGALGASGQGAFDASDVPVGLGGDDPAFLPFPQPG
jgi:hypothetical protein